MSLPLFLLLLTILSLDAFAAGLSYGTEKVRVSPFSLLLLALVSAGVLTLSLAAGDRFLGLFPPAFTKLISFAVLLLLALYKFYDARKAVCAPSSIAHRVNQTRREVLSAREALLLGLALSIDNISAGICTGTNGFSPLLLFVLTGLIHLAAILAGLSLGRLLASRLPRRFSFLGGLILLILAFLRLF